MLVLFRSVASWPSATLFCGQALLPISRGEVQERIAPGCVRVRDGRLRGGAAKFRLARLRRGLPLRASRLDVGLPLQMLGGQLIGERLGRLWICASSAVDLGIGQVNGPGDDVLVLGAIVDGLWRRSLTTDQGDLVRQWPPRDGVLIVNQLTLVDERRGEVWIGRGVTERLAESRARQHDHEHVLDRGKSGGRGCAIRCRRTGTAGAAGARAGAGLWCRRRRGNRDHAARARAPAATRTTRPAAMKSSADPRARARR